jgi:putative transposase
VIRPLRRAHKRLSRRQKGSSNHAKAKHMLARLYKRTYNKRRDFLHKLSTEYSRRHDVVFLERLRTPNMVKNRHVARYILDSGWRTFKTMLVYKAKMVVEVEPRNTSIDCSRCGNSVQKSLALRTHTCDVCGLILDRDYNASLNILRRGLSYLPAECREVTPVEIVRRSKKQETMPLGVGSSPIVTL